MKPTKKSKGITMTDAQITQSKQPMSVEELETLLSSVVLSTSAEGEAKGRRSRLAPNWKEIEEVNSLKKQSILSGIFGGRDSVCNRGVREFWIYATSKEDAKKVKEQARKIGYKRAQIFIPKVGSPEDNTISIPDPDPRHAYAVTINSSTELVIGDVAKKFVKLNEPIIEVVKDSIIFTYAHQGIISYTCDSVIEANLVMLALAQHYEGMANHAIETNQQPINYEITKGRAAYGSPQITLEIKP